MHLSNVNIGCNSEYGSKDW